MILLNTNKKKPRSDAQCGEKFSHATQALNELLRRMVVAPRPWRLSRKIIKKVKLNCCELFYFFVPSRVIVQQEEKDKNRVAGIKCAPEKARKGEKNQGKYRLRSPRFTLTLSKLSEPRSIESSRLTFTECVTVFLARFVVNAPIQLHSPARIRYFGGVLCWILECREMVARLEWINFIRRANDSRNGSW